MIIGHSGPLWIILSHEISRCTIGWQIHRFFATKEHGILIILFIALTCVPIPSKDQWNTGLALRKKSWNIHRKSWIYQPNMLFPGTIWNSPFKSLGMFFYASTLLLVGWEKGLPSWSITNPVNRTNDAHVSSVIPNSIFNFVGDSEYQINSYHSLCLDCEENKSVAAAPAANLWTSQWSTCPFGQIHKSVLNN